MSSLPLPIRVAAGLAAIALERARRLPRDVSEWPMTAVSQALQVSMRVQQRITELAIKGDEALAGLREAPEDPPWAVFDEDLPRPSYLRPQTGEGQQAGAAPAFDDEVDGYDLGGPDATTAEEQSWLQAIDEVYERSGAADGAQAGDVADVAAVTTQAPVGPAETADTSARNGGHAGEGERGHAGEGDGRGPGVLPSYPGLSLASVRGRLRTLSVEDLEELLEYERGHRDRAEFVRLLTNRIATVRNR